MGVVYKSKNVTRCSHCGEVCNKDAKFCKNCTRAESRRELCNENVEIFEAKGMTYRCEMCKINVNEKTVKKSTAEKKEVAEVA